MQGISNVGAFGGSSKSLGAKRTLRCKSGYKWMDARVEQVVECVGVDKWSALPTNAACLRMSLNICLAM